MDQYIHVAIKDLLSNPFRRVEHYPIRREKVEALKESIERTGFWDNLLVRPAKHGKYERAFGEHRHTALKEHYNNPNHKVGVIVRDLSDTDMLQIMARENREEWGVTSGIVEIETVHSVVQAYADGRIKLPKPDLTNVRVMSVRYAPLFTPQERGFSTFSAESAYTSASVATFLGWGVMKVNEVLTALQFIVEDQILTLDEFVSLSSTQSLAVIQQARKVYLDRIRSAKAIEKAAGLEQNEGRKARLKAEADTYRRRAKEGATKVGKGVSQALKTGERGYREASDIADELIYREPKEKTLPDADKFIQKLSRDIWGILRPKSSRPTEDYDRRTDRLDAVLRAKKDLAPEQYQHLALNLVQLSKRSMEYANKLSPEGNAVKFVSRLNDRLLEDTK